MAVIIMLAYAAGFISVSFASGIQCARSIIPYVDGITARSEQLNWCTTLTLLGQACLIRVQNLLDNLRGL